MAGEHSQLVQLAHATEDPDARQLIMHDLAVISQFAGGDGQLVADTMAAAVLHRIRAQALDTLVRLMVLDNGT